MGFLGNQFRFGGQENFTLTGTSRVLSAAEASNRVLVFDSASAACTVTLPVIAGADWSVVNSTDYALTFAVPGGSTSVQVQPGCRALIFCDSGTGLFTAPGEYDSTNSCVVQRPAVGFRQTLQSQTGTATTTTASPVTLIRFTPSEADGVNGVLHFVGGCRDSSGYTKLFDLTCAYLCDFSGSPAVTIGTTVSNLWDGSTDQGNLGGVHTSAAICYFDADAEAVVVVIEGISGTLTWWGQLSVTSWGSA